MLLWLRVTEVKMIGKVFELKESLIWIRKMEVVIWSMMIVASMMMILVMIVVIIRPAMFQKLTLRIWCFHFQLGEGELSKIVPCLKSFFAKSCLNQKHRIFFIILLGDNVFQFIHVSLEKHCSLSFFTNLTFGL